MILGKQIIFINDFESKLTSFYFIGGGLNVVLNSTLYFCNIFKPEYYIGTTILAEGLVVLLEIQFIRKHKLINLSSVFSSLYKYLVVSLGFIPIYFITKFAFHVHSYE